MIRPKDNIGTDKTRIAKLKINRYWIVALFITSALNVAAEEEPAQEIAPPNTEVHLFDLAVKDGQYVLTGGKNVSNNAGYDNQPYFTDQSESLLFVSVRDGKQSDVFELNIESQETTQITKTPHSEYSPKTFAGNKEVTFVSEGGNPYQSVWSHNRMSGKSRWLLNSKEPVGYYSTNEESGDVLFWSRYGWSVQYLNIKHDQGRFVSGNALPSSPQNIPNSGEFSFVHRQTNSEVWIKSFNPKDFSITPIAPIYGANYEYTWAPNGDLLRMQDNQLFVWPYKSKGYQWQKVQDLGGYFKGKASRLAVSKNGRYIAVVENR